MKTFLPGAALLVGFALCTPAVAASGECSMTGYQTFACEVDADGGGFTFLLPDEQAFVFAQIEDGEGLGYLIPADSAPGRNPKELGSFAPVDAKPGCWMGAKDDIEVCVAIEQ